MLFGDKVLKWCTPDTSVSHSLMHLTLQIFEKCEKTKLNAQKILLESKVSIPPQEYLTIFMQTSYNPRKLRLHLICYLQEVQSTALHRGTEKIPKMSQVDYIRSVFNSNAPYRAFKATFLHIIRTPLNKNCKADHSICSKSPHFKPINPYPMKSWIIGNTRVEGSIVVAL